MVEEMDQFDWVASDRNRYVAKVEDEVFQDYIAVEIMFQIQMQELVVGTSEFDDALKRLSNLSQTSAVACFLEAEALNVSHDSRPPEQVPDEVVVALYQRAIDLGLPRLRDPLEPFEMAPTKEREMRELIAMSITNIGARLANTGRQKEAVEHFLRAVSVFPYVPNTHVCLGNMGIYYPDASTYPPRKGYEAWKLAIQLEDNDPIHYTPYSDFRKAVVDTCGSIAANYGDLEMEQWLRRLGEIRKDEMGRNLVPVVLLLRDFEAKTDLDPEMVLSDAFFEILRPSFGSSVPLELKVTLAGTVLANLALLDGDDAISEELIDGAIDAVSFIDPLHPLIGDDEWQDLSSPATDYLMEEQVMGDICHRIHLALELLRLDHPTMKASAAISGFMFKLDRGFRNGVAHMVKSTYSKDRGLKFGTLYQPGLSIGTPADQ